MTYEQMFDDMTPEDGVMVLDNAIRHLEDADYVIPRKVIGILEQAKYRVQRDVGRSKVREPHFKYRVYFHGTDGEYDFPMTYWWGLNGWTTSKFDAVLLSHADAMTVAHRADNTYTQSVEMSPEPLQEWRA